MGANLLDNGNDDVILCLGCAPQTGVAGSTRVGRQVHPVSCTRPAGGATSGAIEVAKANRFRALEEKDKKLKKKKQAVIN